MEVNKAIDVLKDLVTNDKKAGNSTEFYIEIPGCPAYGFLVDLENLLPLLSDPNNQIHKALGIVGGNLLPGAKGPDPRVPGLSIPIYDMDQLSEILKKQDPRPA